MTNNIQKPTAGTVLHFLKSGLVYHRASGTRLTGEVSRRGEQYVLTEADIENTDREGRSFWSVYLFDEDAQVARWGSAVVAPGPAPVRADGTPALTSWDPDSQADRDQERADRMDQLVGVAPHAKSEAVAQIDRELGKTTTSTTINTVRGV